MTPPVYSSMEAFRAHYFLLRGLARSGALSGSDRDALAAMESAVQSLLSADRDALFESATGGQAARRRHRAELKLRRALLARGILKE